MHSPLLQLFILVQHSTGTGHRNVIVPIAYERSVAIGNQAAGLANLLSLQLATSCLTVEPPLGGLTWERGLRLGVHLQNSSSFNCLLVTLH